MYGWGKDGRRSKEEGGSRDRKHTWVSGYIHGRENTYIGERIHTWVSE